MFTSLKLSKLLQENGFEGESEMVIDLNGKIGEYKYAIDADDSFGDCGFYRCFDILNDLCVKYAKEIFGDRKYITPTGRKRQACCLECGIDDTTGNVFNLLQQNEQEEAEEYIWSVCVFNSANLLK